MTDAQRPDEPNRSPTTTALAAALAARQPEFLAFLERRLGDRALAEDVLQDAFLRSIDKLRDLRDPGAAVAWFYRMLRNAATDQRRRSGASSRALASFAAELESTDAEPETHHAVCRCVSAVAEALKPEYAEALRRVEVDGVAVKDYADEAGITSNNAGVRAFRARAALKKGVHATCGACASRGCADCTCGT